VAQNEGSSDADLMFRAMTHQDSENLSETDKERIDRALKEAAAEAHRKKVKLRQQAGRFWKDPFSPDPDKLLPVRPPAASTAASEIDPTRRELVKAREEAAVARAEAAAAKAEAARANAARARAEANAAYQTALAAKKEAEAARASCQESRLAKSPASPSRTSRPKEVERAPQEGLVTASQRPETAWRRGKDKDEARGRTLTQADTAPPIAATGGTRGDNASAGDPRGWRNGIVVVPLSADH
jgi:colicin import membrane protein